MIDSITLQLLRGAGLLTGDQVARVTEESERSGRPWLRTAVEIGLVSDRQLVQASCAAGGLSFPDLATYPVDERVTQLLSMEDCCKWAVLPVAFERGAVVVAMTTLSDSWPLQQVTALLGGLPVRPVLATRVSLRDAIARHHGVDDAALVRGPDDGLIDAGLLTAEQAAFARAESARRGRAWVRVAVECGLLQEGELVRAFVESAGLTFLELGQRVFDPAAVALVPRALCSRYTAVPVRFDGEQVVVAMADPANIFAVDDVQVTMGRPVKPAAAGRADVLAAIDRIYGPAPLTLAPVSERVLVSALPALSRNPSAGPSAGVHQASDPVLGLAYPAASSTSAQKPTKSHRHEAQSFSA